MTAKMPGKTSKSAKKRSGKTDARQASAKPGNRGDEATPRLLSGGNPQIAKGYGDEPVQAYIAAMPGWKREIGRRLDTLISHAVPGVCKAVKWNSPFYGVEEDVWFLSFHCFARYVKVAFLDGTSLQPMPPVASKTPNTRYLHIHEDDTLDEEQWTRWLKQASQLPGVRM